MAAAVAAADSEAIAAAEFAFHRAFNHATGRIKLAWFLLHVARYMPLTIYAADPEWGASTVDNHRKLVEALRRRDATAVVELTHWQFTDAARRLTETLDRSGIWG
jgi:DNA-binding GntR family transcriptional regulator